MPKTLSRLVSSLMGIIHTTTTQEPLLTTGKNEISDSGIGLADAEIEGLESTLLDPNKSLIDAVIEQSERTQNQNPAKRYAEKLEKRGLYTEAFGLYERINDTSSMQRVANAIFLGEIFLKKAEEFARRAGLELTADLYNQRGLHFFKQAEGIAGDTVNYRFAAEAYIKAGNIAKARECALELEGGGTSAMHAVWVYLKLKDEESTQRVAKRIFIKDVSVEGRLLEMEMLKAWGLSLTITPDMWNARGNYWLQKGNYNCAIQAYREAGNGAGVKLAAQRALH